MARPPDTDQGRWADIATPVFNHLTTADGLPYPVALGVVQDRQGFIWAATPGGIARWDGYHMKVFRHDNNIASSLPENIITAAFSAPNGRLWFSSVSGLVASFDPVRQDFTAYRHPGGNFGRPSGLTGDGAGGIWIAGRQGLFRLDKTTGEWTRENALPQGDVSCVLVDRSGRLWVGTSEGLMWRAPNETAFTSIKMPASMKGDATSFMFEDSGGTIWFGSRRGRVGHIDADRRKVNLETALPPSGFRVTAFVEPRPGLLWVGEYGGGIRELNTQSKTVRLFRHDPASSTSLADNAVTGLLVDRSGLVWISSLRGIDRHIAANQRVMTMVPHTQNGLPGDDVRSVTTTKDRRLWLGFRSAGLVLLDPATNSIKTRPDGRWPKDLPAGTVQAIADTADGTLWVGQSTGLRKIDLGSGTIQSYPPLADANVWGLLVEGDGLWAGGYMGLAYIPRNGGPPRLYSSVRKDPKTLSDNSVVVIFRDRAQRLWLGTQRGLNLLENPETGTFRRIFSDPNDPESLPGDSITSITQDRFGRLWLATANGICIFDPEQVGKPRFTRLGAADGLPNGPVLSIIEDSAGMIFAATGDGLAVINPDTLKVRILGPAEGVEVKTFWTGAAAKATDGVLVFGGFGGMVQVHPTSLPKWDFSPPVVVTDVRAGPRSLSSLGEIVVLPEDSGFSVEFAALDFSAPERNRYAYRLDGGDWLSVDSQHRMASYTNLAPGRHHLEILGSNSIGLWAPPLVVNIRVLPAWYQTVWFHLLVFGLFLAAIATALQVRKAYYRRREQELILQVDAKTAEVEAAMQRAVAGEEEARKAKVVAETADQMKSRFLAIIGHEIRTPLNGLLGMLQVLDPRAPDQDCLSTAKQAGEMLRHLVENVLEYGRDGAANQDALLHEVDIAGLVTQIVNLVRNQAETKGLTLITTTPADLPPIIRVNRAKLSRILLNLLGNAIKFTDSGTVSLVATLTDDGEAWLSFQISDTGIGIPAPMRQAIFGEFVQADDSITRKFGGVGLGLAISRRMAEQMGGTLVLVATSEQGSCFQLDVPIKAAAMATAIPAAPKRIGDQGASRQVLVVDDDEINLRVARRLLEHLGHHPHLAKNGMEAVAAAASTAFDVILMDLHMPDMDGLEASRQIRQQERGRADRPRIIAMTADLTDETLAQCLAAGMDSGLAKPVQLEILSDHMMDVVDTDFLDRQVAILGLAEMIHLARTYNRVARQMIAEMGVAAAAGDLARIEALAHRLCSASGPLALVQIRTKAARIESMAKTGTASFLHQQIVQLDADRRVGLRLLARQARLCSSQTGKEI
ncbi:hybrid sensor histidine kinase/response regulator [Magnetospirillum sulfuroxidans]|uniref:histidine kinase n=1 Tax=Magnetospirillum sulfuroxidans TaxID=611300 RepID=A0ABS5I9H4_9PROT|nr:hybrid sensor histidine kinase/response regulator [Magnetospirillum sulfuroxidans]MBR9971062.1 response regulator [Magnetospirillum sulfuroxidans]